MLAHDPVQTLGTAVPFMYIAVTHPYPPLENQGPLTPFDIMFELGHYAPSPIKPFLHLIPTGSKDNCVLRV